VNCAVCIFSYLSLQWFPQSPPPLLSCHTYSAFPSIRMFKRRVSLRTSA
jgi:hypothetical protein